ncbi:IS66 family insertion sequence element accessory protein TnpB [Pseudomonas sp. CFSAN084952]|uniref:IS66 family insertion sequence element accessory protein TnpB n=1 Tax=Pseudomonas TaxID=286 RepID=UPI002115911C|nr:IS66 family insertion sequence element accessory protein TnpB [Pseudomonas sp. CFSAN084952]
MLCSRFSQEPARHDAARHQSRKSVRLPQTRGLSKTINGLAAFVELDIKVAVFDPVLFVFLNKSRNRVKILYWERNGFCLWLKRLESE